MAHIVICFPLQGLMATVLKQASNQGLRFMFFNKYKDIMTNNGEKELGTIGVYKFSCKHILEIFVK
jgi:hypothetical protein